MQPLWTKKNCANSLDEKIMQPLGTKTNHATSRDKKNHATYGDFLIQINAYPKPFNFISITKNVNLADIQQWEESHKKIAGPFKKQLEVLY